MMIKIVCYNVALNLKKVCVLTLLILRKIGRSFLLVLLIGKKFISLSHINTILSDYNNNAPTTIRNYS